MIGVGVYVGSYYALMGLRDGRLVLIVWGVGALHALCGAIAYGAIAKRLPVSGGEYAYLTRCVHPAIGFVAGWISILAGFTAPIAASALLLGTYILNDGERLAIQCIATAAILIAAVMYSIELKVGARFNNGVIAIKLLCFGVFLCLGLPFVLQSGCTGMLPNPSGELDSKSLLGRLSEPDTLAQMVVSLFYVSLAYTGFNASIYLAGQMENANASASASSRRNWVSRSMWIACLLVAVIYLLLNTVFLFGLPAERIVAAGESFVVDVARNIGGTWLAMAIRIAILLSAASSILAMMAIGPMVYAQMASDGRLPHFFQVARDGVPRFAIAVQALLSVSVVWFSTIQDVVKYLGLTLTACGALAVSSVWLARKTVFAKAPLLWYEQWAAALYIGGAVVLLGVAGTLERERTSFWLCTGSFGLGLIVYAISSFRGHISQADSH